MFTAPAFILMREKCPDELEHLLRQLDIAIPNFESGNEFDIYRVLDEEIISKLCKKLKCSSESECYKKLLNYGGVQYLPSESNRDLLEKVVRNREKILKSGSNIPKINLTCNLAEKRTFSKRSDDNFILSLARAFGEKFFGKSNLPERISLIVRKKDLPLSNSAIQEIKTIVNRELGDNFDEIVISIIPSSRMTKSYAASTIQNADDVLDILEKINNIFNKI